MQLTSLRARPFQLLAAICIVSASGQQPPTDPAIDESVRASVIERLISKIEAGYVIPETGTLAIRDIRTAHASGKYESLGTARQFAERLTADLRSGTKDKHIA